VILCASPWLVSNSALGVESAIEHETPDDPPSKHVARTNPLARSPRLNVSFGSYTSIQVNVDALGQNIVGDAANEPTIAVNPTNPSNMVIGWRQFDDVASNFRQGGWAYTTNGGATWTFPGVLEPGVFRSDPVLGVDLQGNFYYQSLKGDLTADVWKSTNGGVSWLSPVPEFGGDKNWLAVDRSGGPSSGHIYGIWQRFGGACCGSNVLTRSVNGGASFQTPVSVTRSPTFGMLAVGPNGDLYAAGIDGTTTQDLAHFVYAKSTNAKNPAVTPTFTGARVDLGGSMRISAGPNPGGLLGQANIAVDSSTGASSGNVYVAASVLASPDPVDVKLIRSTDGGTTWSAPVRVNDDPLSTNWQWLAAHSVAPNGRIDMVWNDTRASGQSNLSQLYYAYSWDGGVTWSPNVPVSPVFDSLVGFPNQNKIGDYSGIVSDNTGADVAYAATFNNEQDIYYVRVFPDCNGNGIYDETDIANATSGDCDANHVPDECQDLVCGPSLAYASNNAAGTCPAGGPGGGNGAVDPGEDVALTVTLKNNGIVNLTNVSAILSTSTPGVTVTRAAAAFPNLPTHGVASSTAPSFAFTVGTGVACGSLIDFTIAASADQGSWTRTFTVRVGAVGSAPTTFNSTDVPKPIDDGATFTSNLTIAATDTVLDVDVALSITHESDADLILTLVAPSGTRVVLASQQGGSGQNYTGTIFDDEAATSITTGSAPFTGRFRPQQSLSVLDGIPANGTWKLEIQDFGPGGVGTLVSWSLTLTVPSGFVCTACNVSAPVLEPVALSWSSKTSIAWESIAGASFYDLYRGAPGDLPNLLNPVADSCRRSVTTGTSTGSVLAETPPDGSFFWYLVRAANGAGEGPAGNATAGPRSQESTGGCP
jgi:subtilisin-like proprotein convertase family protein